MAVANRTIVAPQPKTNSRRLQIVPVLLLALFAVVVIGLLRVVQTSQATTVSFAMQSLQQEKLELEANVSQLEAEVASLASLSRIERDAARLGLKPPESEHRVTVNVAWGGAAEDLLPARFAPVEAEEVDGSPEESGWWHDLLKRLPLY